MASSPPNGTTTLWDLPVRPLPAIGIVKPASTTVWLILAIAPALSLRYFLAESKPSVWPEFRGIWTGSAVFIIWYITEVVDQFLHLDSCSTFMGYIIVQPIFEVTRIVSTTVFLSATQALIYRELKDLIGKRHQRILFLLSKCSIFVIGLTSIYYLVLNFALAVAWMEFLSPSIIDDLANSRTLLEICLMAFFAFCTASMLLEVSWPCMRTFRRRHPLATTPVNIWLATCFLFARSMAELAIVNQVYNSPSVTRQSTKFATDTTDGLLTSLFLFFMYMAAKAASNSARRHAESQLVESDVRFWILRRIQDWTETATSRPPPFNSILRDIEWNLPSLLREGFLSLDTSLTLHEKIEIAHECLSQMRRILGNIEAQNLRGEYLRGEYLSSRSALSEIFAREAVGTRMYSGKPGSSRGPSTTSTRGPSVTSTRGPSATSTRGPSARSFVSQPSRYLRVETINEYPVSIPTSLAKDDDTSSRVNVASTSAEAVTAAEPSAVRVRSSSSTHRS